MTNSQQEVIAQIMAIKTGKNQAYKDASHPTVFKGLLDSDLPAEEKAIDRLFQDGFTLITAGMETTSYTLELATFHVLDNSSIFQKLHNELLLAIPNPTNIPAQTELEKLPYLTAVITEGTR
jgi:cytochrome P450